MLEYLPKLPPENNFQNPITNAVTQTKISTLAKAKTLFFFGEAIVWIADSDWLNLVTHTAWVDIVHEEIPGMHVVLLINQSYLF